MRKYAIVAAGLLLSLVLGATVFSQPIAWAAQEVGARIVSPLDSQGNVAVHEQGTANVNVTNSALSVIPTPAPVTGGGDDRSLGNQQVPFDPPATASALSFTLTGEVVAFGLKYQGETVAAFWGPAVGGHSAHDLALTRPVKFDLMFCVTNPGGHCNVGWVGAQP